MIIRSSTTLYSGRNISQTRNLHPANKYDPETLRNFLHNEANLIPIHEP